MLSNTTPTVGRMLWYWLGTQSLGEGEAVMDPKQPFSAQVMSVNGDKTVNVIYFDHAGGGPFPSAGVELHDPSAEGGDFHGATTVDYVTWMPYQKAQEQKAATAAAFAEAKRDEG